ncbi:DUF4175 family protein [Crateriforma conspicua]|uniref:Uncharacterized protein n=1 Tax=Crateriforma conspicua TaxID=2527996 RepID=A0A5C6FMH5_9PLAN|nr:DUF4175 family protein [Crateriforma conspicua]TWU62669.1 hypothetical protein V7x_44050 [Crateriforma conspicua]
MQRSTSDAMSKNAANLSQHQSGRKSAGSLRRRLDTVSARYRSRLRWRFVAGIGIGVALFAMAVWYGLTQGAGAEATPQDWAVAMGVATLVALIVMWWMTRRGYRDLHSMAERLESRYPSLGQRLMTAVKVLEIPPDRYGYLQQRLLDEVNHHGSVYRWNNVVSGKDLWFSRLAGLGAVGVLSLLLFQLGNLPMPSSATASSSSNLSDTTWDVQPGDVEIERGTGLVVTARRKGATESLPDDAILLRQNEDESREELPMRRNLNDDVLGTLISGVDQPMKYQVVIRGDATRPQRSSPIYDVQVFDYPALVRSDATLAYPGYTNLPEKKIQDTRRVAAVEGTKLTWDLTINKVVRQAMLIDEQGQSISLTALASDVPVLRFDTTLVKSGRYKLRLIDDKDRENKTPDDLVIRVLPNKPPEIKLDKPRDLIVSALEEVNLSAKVRDSFRITRAGLSFRHNGDETEVVLAEDIDGNQTKPIEHLLTLEDLSAQPDDLITYHFWAEDIGPDGQTRRTTSDLFLAEVRPFEEIFREGQSPPGGQPSQNNQNQQNGQQAEQIADLQKQIINATWGLIRRSKSDPTVSVDAAVVAESQTEAMTQLDEMAKQLQDNRSQQFAAEGLSLMERSAKTLSNVAESIDMQGEERVQTLRDALDAQQSAYQKLLQLRGREFQVSRSQQNRSQSSSSGSQSQNRQRRLQQLQLESDPSRYESQQQAESPSEPAEQRETRQVLNRLRELARRQQDLNQQLVTLQSALQNAEDDEERQQLQRQLERLRQQQEELLRETDELNQRMQSPVNQSQMSQQSQQLEQTRENVRQASEALQQSDVGGALSAGKRAEREFEQLRDEVRQQAAGQFDDQMRQLQQQARDLEQQQREINEGQREESSQRQPGLRREQGDDSLLQQIRRQREDLDDLMDQIQDTVQQAETAEPLLAQKLYDGYRRGKQSRIDQALSNMDQLVQRGFEDESRPLGEQALQAIETLRQDVDQAAESVLGDPTEGLRRAADKLERLDESLKTERGDRQASAEDTASGEASREEQASSDGRRTDDEGSRQNPDGPDTPSGEDSGTSPGQRPQAQQQSDQQQGQRSQSQRSQGQQQQQQQQQQGRSGQGQASDGQSEQSQPRERQPGQAGQRPSQASSDGQRGGTSQSPQQGTPRQRPSLRGGPAPNDRRGAEGGGGQIMHGGESPDEGRPMAGPFNGDAYSEWTDELRDVEEMLETPELRSRATQIRDRARELRREQIRHSKPPQWEVVDEMIATPLRELRRAVREELMRRTAEKNSKVPIDRDPVPGRFADAVQRYYENLGSGQVSSGDRQP